MIALPSLYAILDAEYLIKYQPPLPTENLVNFARELSSGGLRLLQYRNKRGTSRQMLEDARILKNIFGNSAKLIMNDRADLSVAAGFDGVHLGQDDLSPEDARVVVGENRWIGLSTHNPEQATAADQTCADYIAIGPVFATSSKANPDPAVGLEGVRRARALTRKPLVAIGGITRGNCRSVIDAGADAVAVISDLLPDPRKSVEEFLRILG
jgi:thiamine-phosphate pyrophosphorylase